VPKIHSTQHLILLSVTTI